MKKGLSGFFFAVAVVFLIFMGIFLAILYLYEFIPYPTTVELLNKIHYPLSQFQTVLASFICLAVTFVFRYLWRREQKKQKQTEEKTVEPINGEDK